MIRVAVGVFLSAFFCLGNSPVLAQTGESTVTRISEADAKVLISSLIAMQAGQRSEIASADISYHTLRLDLDELKLTPEQFLQRMQKIDLSKPEAVMMNALREFKPQLAASDRRDLWLEKRLLVRGNDSISESSLHDHIKQGDLHVLIDHANQQAQCFNRGQCLVWTEDLLAFRSIPPPQMLEEGTYYRAGDLIQAHFKGTPESPVSWMLIDPNDGLLRQQHIGRGVDAPYKDIWNQQFITFPGGVQFPLVKFEISYRNGVAGAFQVTSILDATFNTAIADDEFHRARTKGSTWIDLRNDGNRGGTFKADVPDILEFFRSRENIPILPESPMPSSNSNRVTSLIFLINGLALLAIGVYLWKRVPTPPTKG